MTSIEQRLRDLGYELPPPAASVGRYAPHVVTGNLFWSVQGPVAGSELRYVGRVGADFDLETARECARFVCLNVLRQLADACTDDMDRVVRAVRLGGYIRCTDDFQDHTLVMNAASDLVLDAFGDRGRHARFVVGCNSLPFGLALEIEGVFEIQAPG